jgi:HAD superfamily hydrolase (TIGR01509 family)
LAFEACADLTNELLQKHGIAARYTAESLLEQFVGQNFRGMMLGLQKLHGFTMDQNELEEYVQAELGKVVEKLKAKAQPCPDVPEELEKIKQKGYPMAVVSTSAKPRVIASLEKTDLMKYFKNEHVYSAATSLNPPSSKPDPKIYNFACEQLGVKNEQCVTVEDSKSGATAAMRANIPCIGYVGIYRIEEGEEKMKQMEQVLKNDCKCKVIMYDWKDFDACLKKVEEGL